MAVQVASLFGVLSLDDKDFQDGLKNADGGLKTTADKLKNFGTGMQKAGVLTMGAATPVLAFGANAVNSAGQSQLAMAQLNAVIESTGGAAGVTADHANELATNLQSVTRFSDESVMAGESMLLTFTNIGASGGVFDLATQTSLDMATALGQDVTQSAMQLGKALNDPINGVTALQRVGVTFTDSQKDQIEAMVQSGDVMGAQKLILQELQKEFGGSAVAAGKTFPGQMDIMMNKMDDVNETIGIALIPALSKIADNLTPIITGVGDWAAKNPDLIIGILGLTAGAFVLGGVISILGTTLSILGGILAFVSLPAVLLGLAIAGIVYAADKLYPGGIKKLFDDARTSAFQLGVILFGVGGIAGFITTKIEELVKTILDFKKGVDGIVGITNLVTSGQVTPGQVLGAVGNEIGANAGHEDKYRGVTAKYWGQRAGGGSVMGGGSYLVGEQGPELFTPSTSGNISTASQTAGMMGGMNIGAVNVYANTYEGGQAAAQGFRDKAISMGYSFG